MSHAEYRRQRRFTLAHIAHVRLFARSPWSRRAGGFFAQNVIKESQWNLVALRKAVRP